MEGRTKMMESVIHIGEIPTKCGSLERRIGDDLSDCKVLVLIIPGNPGIVDFYYEFMSHLSGELKERFPDEVIPIWSISHAGHHADEIQSTQPPLESSGGLYSLQGQLCHKAKFIDLHIPSHVKVILIGHSIGSYLGQELLKAKPEFSDQVIHFCLLFPTIMDMRKSPNGKFYVATQSLHWLLLSVLSALELIPKFLRRSLVSAYFWLKYPKAKQSAQDGILTLIRKPTFEKVLTMANAEMTHVCDLDVTFLEANVHRLFVYFGASDGWCPMDFVKFMTQQVPNLEHTLCQEGIAHAFVLDNSRRMSEIIAWQLSSLKFSEK